MGGVARAGVVGRRRGQGRPKHRLLGPQAPLPWAGQSGRGRGEACHNPTPPPPDHGVDARGTPTQAPLATPQYRGAPAYLWGKLVFLPFIPSLFFFIPLVFQSQCCQCFLPLPFLRLGMRGT